MRAKSIIFCALTATASITVAYAAKIDNHLDWERCREGVALKFHGEIASGKTVDEDPCGPPPRINKIEDWDLCRDKFIMKMHGVVTTEEDIVRYCGEQPPMPTTEVDFIKNSVSRGPMQVVNSVAWKSKFEAITKDRYKAFLNSFTDSSSTVQEGDWAVASGTALLDTGAKEAAFAINIKTGQVYGAMTSDGNDYYIFGFGTLQDAPPYLKNWFDGREIGVLHLPEQETQK